MPAYLPNAANKADKQSCQHIWHKYLVSKTKEWNVYTFQIVSFPSKSRHWASPKTLSIHRLQFVQNKSYTISSLLKAQQAIQHVHDTLDAKVGSHQRSQNQHRNIGWPDLMRYHTEKTFITLCMARTNLIMTTCRSWSILASNSFNPIALTIQYSTSSSVIYDTHK